MGLCACMGPQGNDPLCPCQMRQAGLTPTPVWKPGDKEELQRVLAENEERFREPPCMECGALTQEEAETKCRCCGDKDDCHGCQLWPD